MNTPHHDQFSLGQHSSASNPKGSLPGGSQGAQQQGAVFGRPLKTALLMVALVGSFYLLREHWAHVVGIWIYLLLLACPLMHLFHGHGGHGGHGAHATPSTQPTDKD